MMVIFRVLILALIGTFGFQAVCQETPSGWEGLTIGMSKADALKIVNKRCLVRWSRDFPAETCGTYFGQDLAIFLHFEGGFAGFGQKLVSFGLSIDSNDLIYTEVHDDLLQRWGISEQRWCMIKKKEQFRCLTKFANNKIKLYDNLTPGLSDAPAGSRRTLSVWYTN